MDAHAFSHTFPVDHKLNPYFVRHYQLEDELGSGGYGFVMTAKHREEGYEVAVKFIVKSKVPEHGWMEDTVVGRVPTEVMLLSLINHDNIVKCFDLFEDPLYFYLVQELHGSPWPKANRKRQYRCVSESYSSPASDASSTPSLSPSASVDSLSPSSPATPASTSSPPLFIHRNLDSGELFPDSFGSLKECQAPRPSYSRRPSHDLFECIEQSEDKRLSEAQARHIFSQVVDAVHYLHFNGIAHRDIKDENIVIDKDMKVKLIDFGSAIVVDTNEPPPYYTLFYGTAAYASSEILRKKPYRAAPAEVWTLGVLLSYLVTGSSPFPDTNDAIEGRIVLADDPGRLSREVMHLMRVCLDPNPKTRATIGEIRTHPWLMHC
ncbi:kinase-like domain-containing protein [Mycena floridula]|nr:kinase-like domain-containing protein [Mycena floridula]